MRTPMWVFSLSLVLSGFTRCVSQNEMIPSDISTLSISTSSGNASDIILNGYYRVENAISISGGTSVHISSPDGVILDCVNNTHVFDIESGSTVQESTFQCKLEEDEV